ncbi:UDP-N-acetylmuramate--L-alanine ligase [Tenacibaculum sp. SG-28]|uniref:UDP-N-acetylmuramate--L-alanine ligase n=1 Tax=Tenacibaculum sp. SG-28 TaxID=754426 RepID=UPI000CF4EAE1|nr:UDP-N-acetylmuramate--L-alanine ligase [Tenacibaculum sp. SG-28]PQJ21118.1 UDP-N-acetylmuramate--L-alanine ligase [Tenacibaculum sp. SG-28]
MELSKVHNVYFIGIGGIGMSAIAKYFVSQAKFVAGYDKTPSPITEALLSDGVTINFEDVVEKIPMAFLEKEKTLVIYTPAISEDHQQLTYFRDHGFTVVKRSEALGVITANTFSFGVAGTHGKTTTSSILGHIMQPLGATSFLGGITENYHSNVILGENEITIVEADEFDRSFLRLSPNIACITSMDADHLDIYGEANELEQSFRDFSAKVSDTLLVAKGLPIQGMTYAVNEAADYQAYNIRIENGAYHFTVKTPTKNIEDLVFHLPGKHNLMNALAAIAMADVYGVAPQIIKKQMASFLGVQRRFSYKIKEESIVFIDDYAHHPTEITAVQEALRELYPEDKVLVVFQPHLFSRTQDFADEFASSLAAFDEVILLDIYPAREVPIEGVTSAWLLEKIHNEQKLLSTKKNLVADVLQSSAKIIVTLGAGDIGLLVADLQDKLEEKYNITA